MTKQKKRPSSVVILMIVILWIPMFVSGQKAVKTFHQDDVFSIFMKKEKRLQRDSIALEPIVLNKPYFSITPFIGYNPAYGALIGVSSIVGIFLGDLEDTPVSAIGAAVNLTTADQTIITLRSNIITNHARYILRGDWRFLIFSQPT